MRQAPVLFVAALALGVLGGCAAQAAVPPATPPPVSAVPIELAATRPAVERVLADEVARLKLPGLAFGVVTPRGLAYFVGLGARDASGAPVTPDTVYRIGSVTKTISGMALLQLRDAGKIDFDDPVAKYVPEVAEARLPRPTAAPSASGTSSRTRPACRALGKLAYTRSEVTRADLRDAARSAVLEFAPGTRAVYSNLAMALAGPIIARASGEPYRDYVERHILAPLGMTHTVWDRDAVPPSVLAQAWAEKDGRFVDAGAHWRLGAAESMGGLYSSVADMSRLRRLPALGVAPARRRPTTGPLRRSSVRESQVLAGFSLPGAEGFGVNWIVRSDARLGHVVFHNGATEGYHATVFMLPARGLGVIALGPATMALDGVAFRALAAAAGLDPRGKPPGPAPSAGAPSLGAPASAALTRVRALLTAAADRDAVEQDLRRHVPGGAPGRGGARVLREGAGRRGRVYGRPRGRGPLRREGPRRAHLRARDRADRPRRRRRPPAPGRRPAARAAVRRGPSDGPGLGRRPLEPGPPHPAVSASSANVASQCSPM